MLTGLMATASTLGAASARLRHGALVARAAYVLLAPGLARARWRRRWRMLEGERQWLRRARHTGAACPVARPLAGRELFAGLLAVPQRVVGAVRDLLAVRQQRGLAALHQLLLVEGPGIHEVLQHDHKDPVGEGA